MFKKILQASAQSLLSRPKIMRLAFFTLVCFSIVRLYYLIYYFNTILIWKYESGVQISDALMYFINTLNEHHAIGTIIVAIIIIIVGYLWLYPIGQASVIFALQEPEKSNFSAFSKGLGRYSDWNPRNYGFVCQYFLVLCEGNHYFGRCSGI